MLPAVSLLAGGFGARFSPLLIAGAIAAGLIALRRKIPHDTPEPEWQPVDPE